MKESILTFYLGDLMNSIPFYDTWYQQIQRIEEMRGASEACNYIEAILDYAFYDILPPSESSVYLYGFDTIKQQIDIANGQAISGRPKKSISYSDIMYYKQAGKTVKEIAQIFNVSEGTIYRRLRLENHS